MSLLLFSLNVEGHNHLDRIVPFLAKTQPDIACLQEVFKADLPLLAAATIPDFEKFVSFDKFASFVHFAPMVNIDRKNRVNFPFLGELGVAILSKEKPQQTHHYYYLGSPENIPHVTMNPNRANRAVLAVTFAKSEILNPKHETNSKFENSKIKTVDVVSNFDIRYSNLTIATTHFTWAPDGMHTPEQLHDLKKMFPCLDQLPPHVLVGDFNAPRDKSPIWHTLANRYTDHTPKDIITTLDPHLHRAGPLKWVVDGLFSSPHHYQVTNVSTIPNLSDHQAIMATLSL